MSDVDHPNDILKFFGLVFDLVHHLLLNKMILGRRILEDDLFFHIYGIPLVRCENLYSNDRMSLQLKHGPV